MMQLDRILETIYRRRAAACLLWSGAAPELIVSGQKCELQTSPVLALDLERFVGELLDGEERVLLEGYGHVAVYKTYGSVMTMRVHAAKESRGYALSIHPLTFAEKPSVVA